MSKYVQISTTVAKKSEAEIIAKELVEKRLAGCVQVIGNIKSYYNWGSKLQNSKEFILLVKTSSRLADVVGKTIKRLHSYDLPEIIVMPIIGGSKKYLDWIDKEVRR